MLIEETTKEASLELLTHMHLGRLACAQGSQPYVVPFYFAYDSNYLYSFSTIGQKIDWMRANPLVCVETDEVLSSQKWVSVIIFGRYQELPDTPEWKREREFAHNLLRQKANWWEPGYAKTIVDGAERPLFPLFYRIQITQITGHCAKPDSVPGLDTRTSMRGSTKHWIQEILRQLRNRLKQSK